jgi:hypothetical protein
MVLEDPAARGELPAEIEVLQRMQSREQGVHDCDPRENPGDRTNNSGKGAFLEDIGELRGGISHLEGAGAACH